jgi:ABC-type tungstate transport system substrate-binding protein
MILTAVIYLLVGMVLGAGLMWYWCVISYTKTAFKAMEHHVNETNRLIERIDELERGNQG